MKKIFRSISAVVLAVAVMLTAVVFDVPGKITAKAATTGGCDGNHEGWTAWTSTNSLPNVTNGKYYLTNDVTVTKETSHPSGILYICLNGHTITATNNSRIFYNDAGFLYLSDCKKSGKLTGGNPVNNDGNGGAVYVYSGGVDLYDVTLSGNTAKCGGAVYNYNGFFNIYGGTITNNTATESGGGVYSGFKLDGKVDISGNTVNGSPNNVFLSGSRTISIGDSFSTESSIGVSTAQTPTCSKAITGNCNSDISDCFAADISGQKIKYENDKVWLYVDHDWGSWKTTKNATCIQEGEKERSCITSGCTEKETQTIDKIDHVYENGKCKNCSAIDPNHTHTGGTATCEKKAVCDICEQEYGELGEHSYGAWSITKYPSTTATGTAERACSCGENQTKTDVPVLTDTSVWTKDDTQHVDPTEDGAGKDVYTSVYGTVTVTIPQLGHTHTLTHVDEIPATETTEGVKEHWYCSGCKKDFTDENGTTEISDLTIPVIGHTHTLTHISATETTKEHWHCDCGKDFLDENGEHEATADDLKTGMIEKEVQSGDNAPAATLTTPADELINAVLTEEDKELVNEGKDIKIILTIDDAANKVSNADKAAVEAAIGNESGFILGQCLDVNLLKIIDGRQEKIAQTSTPLTITFEIPVGLRGSGRTFSVIRVHDGETTILEDKDDNENTVTIQTDKFSTYALAYSENTNVTPPGGGSSGGNAPAPSVSKPTNSGDTSSESRGSSDNGTVTSSSGETSSTDENNFMPSESMPTDNNENPATGITMSLVPLAAAVIVLTVTIKRKRNK